MQIEEARISRFYIRNYAAALKFIIKNGTRRS